MDYKAKAKKLVSQMTLEEKASLCSGRDFWYLKGIERLGLKPVMVTDGPHGLRKQLASADHLGISESVPATSFPTASATACSFDRTMLKRMGEALGEKCVSEEVAVILGPGVNIKRSPLCGRNFEYFSEDPYLAGEMAAALIEGVQSKNVGTSIKHFAVNNQEAVRMTCDSVVDERAFREIYLTAFEKAIKQAKPWTVMCSYNKINGTYASDNEYLLNHILRKEWGYEGLVVSDWGATDDRVQGIKAGMDLEMPGASPDNDAEIVAAVKNGTLSEEDLNKSALRITELIVRGQEDRPEPEHVDADHNILAGEIAENCAVLLKNTDSILPFSPTGRFAVIGEMAKNPRYQGAGSSRICPAFLDNAFDALTGSGAKVTYAEGYSLSSSDTDQTKIDEACKLARESDVAVVFAGLPDEYESEGFDRDTMSMPVNHNKLIEAVAKVNPNTVVVLQLGAPVEMPWKDSVKGILIMYLAGQAGGKATADLLLGKSNPSGKLAETFPAKLTDNSSAAYFPGEPKAVQYRESIYVGYRYYDTANVSVAFPFGYGLSYTTFEYSDLQLHNKDTYRFTVTAKITNTGDKAGAEAVQLYVECKESKIFRARKELKAFDKVFLQPGESKSVSFELDRRSFAYYNTKVSDWCVEGGTYDLLVAASSADIRLTGSVSLEGDGKEALLQPIYDTLTEYHKPAKPLRISDAQFEKLLGYKPPVGHMLPGEPFTINSTLSDIKDTFIGKTMLRMSRKQTGKMLGENPDPTMQRLIERSMMDMPLRGLKMATSLSNKKILGLVDFANGKFIKGIKKML